MARVQRVRYFVRNLADRPGELLKVMKDLKARNTSLAGLWGSSTKGGKAQLYVAGKNPSKLRKGWKSGGAGFFVSGADRTGALVTTLDALAGARVNIQAIHAIAIGGKFGSFIWVRDKQVGKAAKALGVHNNPGSYLS
jgi:prephenate dehydratase